MGTRVGVALDRQNCGPTWSRTSLAAHVLLSGNIVSEGCVERFAVVCGEPPAAACTRHRNVGRARTTSLNALRSFALLEVRSKPDLGISQLKDRSPDVTRR